MLPGDDRCLDLKEPAHEDQSIAEIPATKLSPAPRRTDARVGEILLAEPEEDLGDTCHKDQIPGSPGAQHGRRHAARGGEHPPAMTAPVPRARNGHAARPVGRTPRAFSG